MPEEMEGAIPEDELRRLLALGPDRRDLVLDVSTGRGGSSACYYGGEEISLLVRPNRACRVAIIDVTIAGGNEATVTILAPTGFRPGLWNLEGGRTYQWPYDYQESPAEASPPYGIEVVKVLASSEDFDPTLPELAWDSLHHRQQGRIHLGRLNDLLERMIEEKDLAVGTVSFTTIERPD